MISKLRQHLNDIEFGKEYYTFWIMHVLSDILVMNFFQIMLYKATGSLDVIILSYSLNSIVTYLGIVIGGVLLDRFGYLKMYRIAFGLSAIGLFIVASMLNNIAEYYPLFSILIFIPRGLFWLTVHSVELRETNCDNRRVKFNVTQGLYLVLSVVITPVVGFLLTTFNSYSLMFIIGGLVYLTSLLVPFKYNKISRSSLTSVEIVRILKNPRFPAFVGVNLVYSGLYGASAIFATIASYIVLGNELNVGVVVSVASVFGGLALLFKKGLGERNMVRMGFISNALIALVNVLYVVIWGPFVLVVNKIVGGGLSGWSSSTIGDQDYRSREILLGKDLHQSAVEMNLVDEGLYMFGRVVVSIVVLLLLRGVVSSHENIVRLGFGLTSFAGISTFFLFWMYNRKFGKTTTAE